MHDYWVIESVITYINDRSYIDFISISSLHQYGKILSSARKVTPVIIDWLG